MTDPRPTPSDHLDALVRGHLDAEAAKVNARAMLARVRPVEPVPPRRRWLKWVGVGAGVAIAASVAALLLSRPPTEERQAFASASDVLREAKEAEARPADRKYAVSAKWEVTPFQRLFPFRPIAREATLWTRGDQFVVESKFADGGGWVWGQEANGRVWLAANRKRVLVFEADEWGEPLARFCELMSLRLATTLGELLEKHELARRDSGAPGEPIHVVGRARTPAAQGVVRSDRVELFLDPATKAVQRAILAKQLNGETVGHIEFALLPSSAKPDEFYTVGGHADVDAITFDRKPGGVAPDARRRFREELQRRFAPK